MSEAGRVCPTRYHYGAAAIAGAPQSSARTLYVIGGLYGNLPALDALEAMAATEAAPVSLCFNGDFNWFNVDDAGFRAINQRVLRHTALLGNVEAELNEDLDDAGCGCAYPESVDAAVVERSNRIHAALKRTAARHPDLLKRLNKLTMALRWQVGDLRVGVVHGDAESLAGWRFDAACLDDPAEDEWRAAAFEKAGVDVFASSHTCLPAMRSYDCGGKRLIANNGAAGMPNFSGTRFGVLTRIGLDASPHPALYGQRLRGVHVDALAIRYDHARWLGEFLGNWPHGSPGWRSYHQRIVTGPDYSPREAATRVGRCEPVT
jgi:hypothetical protein